MVTASASLRNIPSPEQGASTTILSKKAGNFTESSAGVALVTTAFRTPMRSMFWERIPARVGWISLATKSPSPHSAAASWVALPPGAAQRSSTRSPGLGGHREAGSMALASWM